MTTKVTAALCSAPAPKSAESNGETGTGVAQ
jgi:hypothetical protein